MQDRPEIPAEFWEVVERYRAELKHQAFAILGSQEDAEDVVQETYYEAFRSGQKLSGADSLGAWLRAANRRNALDRIRAKRRTNAAEHDPHAAVVTTGGFSAIELRESIGKAMKTLPAVQREIVALRFWQQLTCKEIAERKGLPQGTVRRILYEASLALFGQLHGVLGKPAPGPQVPPDSTANAEGKKTC
jgi:RNA polymerase sigma-70 factor (ECF subfamily)